MGKVKAFPLENLKRSIQAISQSYAFHLSNNLDPSTTTFGFGYKLGLVPTEGFLKFRLDTIAPRSKIVSAHLKLIAGNDFNSTSNFFIANLARDGKWDNLYVPPSSDFLFNFKMGPSGVFERMRCLIRNGTTNLADAAVSVADVNTSKNIAFAVSDPVNGLLPYVRTLGQVVQASSTGTMDNVVIRILRVGVPSSGVIVRIFSVNASFEPLSLLATSDLVAPLSIGTTFADTVFNFSGANQITITSGTYYAVYVSAADNVFNSSAYYSLATDDDVADTDANERTFMVASKGGFGFGSYPNRIQFPFLYGSGTATIENQPFGSILQKTLTPHANGSTVFIRGLEKIVQEWVNSGDFLLADRIVGFVLSPRDVVWTEFPLFGVIELVVEYEPRRIGIS